MSARNPNPVVTVAVVIHNDAADLPTCFAALGQQSFSDFELVVVDCASIDGGAEIARREAPAQRACTVIELGENAGFAGGMNEAFRHSRAPYFLTLNADVQLQSNFLEVAVRAAQKWEHLPLGAVTPRLVRLGSPQRLDACGMYWTWSWRHLDRGSGTFDRNQWNCPELVFGGTGAATLLVRRALEDVALSGGEIFDPRFHTYREDAELAWRLNARGWWTLYEPAARATHRRCVLPERRRWLSPLANRNSLRNRYLLRIFHQSLGNFLWTLPWTLSRDLGAFAWVLGRERSSLPAYRWLWVHRRELFAHRQWLQQRRRAPQRILERWFFRSAVPLPAEVP